MDNPSSPRPWDLEQELIFQFQLQQLQEESFCSEVPLVGHTFPQSHKVKFIALH